MEETFTLPDLGEGLAGAEIVSWHVAVGDHVVRDQPLLSVETDKAVVEIPSPRAGRIAALHGVPGEVVEVGAPLVEFEGAATPDHGAIVGDGASRAPAAPTTVGVSRGVSPASPAARARARELGVAIDSIDGSGPGGSVTLADVEAAAPSPDHGAERVQGVRRAMLLNMARAGREVVAATITDEADIDDWSMDADVTVRLLRAVAAACAVEPALNAWFDGVRETVTRHRRVDVGVAMETPLGLFTPVLRDIGAATDEELRARLENAKRGVSERTIGRGDLLGQTISLSNFGMFSGRFASLVVVPPQVAILGAGRATGRAVVHDGAIVPRRILPLSLSFDHRAVTGIEAARFLQAVRASLEQPLVTPTHRQEQPVQP